MDTQKMKVQKLVPTEYNGRWGFLDAATGEEVVPLSMTMPMLFL